MLKQITIPGLLSGRTWRLAFIACPLLFSVGCAATQSHVKQNIDCGDDCCEKCQTALSNGAAAAAAAAGEPPSGQMEYSLPQKPADSLTLPTAVPPRPVPPESEPRPQTAGTSAPGLDRQARQECAQLQQQTDELKARLQKLETRLTGERTRQRALRDSLVAVNSKVTSLSEELTYWKSEVRRIDAEAEEQHRQDLESLQTISELISRLPRPSTAAAGNASRH